MDSVALIKERLDLVDFLRQHLALHPAGKNIKALCPFHKEKTPSFVISPERQVWHCFGCGAGGDLFEFVMKYENLEFFEALKMLAEKAGVDLKRFGGQDQKQFSLLYDINQAARDFFVENLGVETAVAQGARQYLAERGLTPETIKEFEIGFAPNASDALTRHLTKLGFRVADVERAGLVFKTERGTYWDRFRDRIMFPLHNHFGKVIAFTGRLMPGREAEEVGKYVNSPETPIFSKSKLLFGFHKSKNFIREKNAAVLVEGQMDFLMMWQEGIKHVVASSGTALTAEHLKPLRRIADTLVVSFDADEAGQRAGESAVELGEAADFTVKMLPAFATPEIKDPADAVKLRPGLMTSLIGRSRPAMEFYFDRYLGRGTGEGGRIELQDTKKGIRAVLQKIKHLASPVERAHWLKELATRTGVPEAALADELALIRQDLKKSDFRGAAPAPEHETAPSRHELIAGRLFGFACASDEYRGKLMPHEELFPPLYRLAFATLTGNTVASPEVQRLIDEAILGSNREAADEAARRIEFEELVRQLRLEHYRTERQLITHRIKRCEEARDAEGLAEALREFDRITKELNTL